MSADVLTDLDQKSRDLLLALDQIEESVDPPTTPDLIEVTGIERAQIHYRLNEYLEPHSLVATHQPEGDPGSVPPKEIRLTDDGRELIEELDTGTDSGSVGDRLERIEERVDALQSTVQDLADADRPTSTAGQDDIDSLQEQVANLAMEVEELKDDPIFDDAVRGEIDATRVGVLALRDYLYSKFDDAEQECAQLAEQYKKEIEPLDQT